MICKVCTCDFFNQYHNGVPLTIVCERCVTSSDLVTKSDALRTGASYTDLNSVRRVYRVNPRYRNGADMQLFVREEIAILASATTERKRHRQEIADRKRAESDAKKHTMKRMRRESLSKRMKVLRGIVPTPGLVSGDFCTLESKTPKVGARSLLARKYMWNRLSGTEIAAAVMIFEWAVTNKRLDITVAGATEKINHERELFDRIATVEGHRVLSFLDEVDRHVLMRTNPEFRVGLFDLPVRKLSPAWVGLCDEIGQHLNIPYSRVLSKLSESKNCWISRYLFTMRPKRVASILEPHFYGPSKRGMMLKRDMEESFARWGLDASHGHGRVDCYCNYFRGDIVDVELYSASCEILKAGLPYHQGIDVITCQVMSTPGTTWMETTRRYIREQVQIRKEKAVAMREMWLMMKEDKRSTLSDPRACPCGNSAALECIWKRCGRCCLGPCARHGRYD
ncbi:unnamed protein product [Ectocarpus sp. 6 AP-2014]